MKNAMVCAWPYPHAVRLNPLWKALILIVCTLNRGVLVDKTYSMLDISYANGNSLKTTTPPLSRIIQTQTPLKTLSNKNYAPTDLERTTNQARYQTLLTNNASCSKKIEQQPLQPTTTVPSTTEFVADNDEENKEEDESDEEGTHGWLDCSGLGAPWPSDILGRKSNGASNWVISLYRHFRARSLHLADTSAGGILLTFAIPKYTRIGQHNKLWQKCDLYTYEGPRVSMIFLGDDPINGDRIFVRLIPIKESVPMFYIKDAESCDEDHPENKSSGFYRLPISRLSSTRRMFWEFTLRDGELTETDRFWDLGVTLFVKAPGSTPRVSSLWNGNTNLSDTPLETSLFFPSDFCLSNPGPLILYYFDEIIGTWRTRQMVPHPEADAYFVCLLEVRSVTFVIYNSLTKTWVKAAKGSNFRVSFPGAFVVYPTGELFECSATLGPFTAPPAELFGFVSTGKALSTPTNNAMNKALGIDDKRRGNSPSLLSGMRLAKEDWEAHNSSGAPQSFNIGTPAHSPQY